MRVKEVSYVKDYKIKLKFSDGVTKVVDLEKWIKENRGFFSALHNLDYFKQVSLDGSLSICWPNGADICPDILYELGKPVPKQKINARTKIRKKRTVSKNIR